MSAGAGTAVRVEGLRKAYGDRQAVAEVDLSIDAGEIVAILGPNGAGKTTTIEILEGYRQRDAGVVEVLGLDPQRRGAEIHGRVGVVLQECEAEPYLSAAETLQQFRAYYPDPRPVDELLDLVDLADHGGVRVRRLSGGQRRRLDLAVALVGRPEIVFLAEPTTGFDPAARRQAWDVIDRLRDEGTTVVLTTHYLEEAEALADRLVILADGRIRAEGTPATIGGRDTSTRIAFDATAPPPGCPLQLSTDGRRCWVDVTDAVRELLRLTEWATAGGHELGSLTVGPRSLDDVYLELLS
jgi:ABC-2 type transport system ATP-binding protein